MIYSIVAPRKDLNLRHKIANIWRNSQGRRKDLERGKK